MELLKHISYRKIVLYISCFYFIVAALFEHSHTGMTRISSVAMYMCLFTGVLYILIKKKIIINAMLKCILVLGGFLVLSTLYTPTSRAIVGIYISRYFINALILIILMNLIEDEFDIQVLLNTYIIAGVSISLYMYYTYGFSKLILSSQRIDGLLGNQNEVGMYCSFAIVISIYELFIQRKKKFLLILAIIICFPAMIFTGSRKSVLIIGCAVLVLFLTFSDFKGKVKGIIWGVLIIFVALYSLEYFSIFSSINARFDQLWALLRGESESNSDLARVYFINTGWSLFLKKPILGNGFLSSYYYLGSYSHNNYIELLMDNGLCGAVSYYSIFGLLLFSIKQIKNNKSVYSFVCMALACLLLVDIGVVSFYNRFTLTYLLIAYKWMELIVHNKNSFNKI